MPPQAYTKETLADAYEWVKNQPAEVRRMATSSDSLVSLYLSYQRRKQEGFDSFFEKPQGSQRQDSAPISGEQFKKELKNLAIGLNEFVDESQTKTPIAPPPAAQPPHSAFAAPRSAGPHSLTSNPASLPHEGVSTPYSNTQSLASLQGLDPLSLTRLQAVRQGLNLSSDGEALRMLITLGYERVKGLLAL